MTSASLQESGNGTALNSDAQWQLNASSDGAFSALVSQNIFADGAVGPTNLTNASQTTDGFDLFLPFTASGNTLSYYFFTLAAANTYGEPLGTSMGASITTTLQGIDAVTVSGRRIGSASFDEQTGSGQIDVTDQDTVPKPTSVVLLATGLAGLVPIVRRKFTR